MWGVGPSTDGEEGFELTVLLLEEVELFGVAVDIVADVVPRIAGEVLVGVGPGVGEEAGLGEWELVIVSFRENRMSSWYVHFTSLRADVCKGVYKYLRSVNYLILR